MSTRIQAVIAMVLLLIASAPVPALAAESYDSCVGKIVSLPAVLTTQGTWCMDKDLSTALATGNAITIASNNITLDCNGFKLGGLAAGVGTATYGVYAVSRLNATVRNCNIRGFARGISFSGVGSAGHAIVDSRFEGNRQIGIFLFGAATTIRGNIVTDSGGGPGDFLSVGIYVSGDATVIDNTVDGVFPASGTSYGSYGIAINDSTSSVVKSNRVSGADGGAATGYGIAVYNGTYVSVVDNDISLGGGTFATAKGIYCGNTTALVDNRLFGFYVGLESCIDDGGNVIKT